MINFLIYLLLASLFFFDWLFFVIGVGGRVMTWIPEFISILIAVSIPFRTATNKQIQLPLKYTILLILYLVHIVIGFFLNGVTGWTILAGLRIYTKFIPIFLIPVIYPSTERAFKNIILWVFVLSMLQLPVVLWQRFITYSTALSGDAMGGTLGSNTSGILSIYLLVIIAFLVAFYFKKEISLSVFLISMITAFIPITLNETKISFLLLPISFMLPAFFMKDRKKIISRILLIFVLFLSLFFVFKGVYNHFQQKKWGYGIETFVTMPGRVDEYSARRIDPIKYSFTKALKDMRFAFFGRGAGNASQGFTKKLSGKYAKEAQFHAVGMTFVKSMWELGILGTILFFLFPIFIFWDAAKLSKQNGLVGAYSLGMVCFSVFFILSTFYTFTLDSNVLVFMFFLSSGQLVQLVNASLHSDELNSDSSNFFSHRV